MCYPGVRADNGGLAMGGRLAVERDDGQVWCIPTNTVIVDGRRPCIRCGCVLPVEAFYRSRYTTNQGRLSFRYSSECKPCGRAKKNADTRKHLEERRAATRVWRANNRDRIKAYQEGYCEAKREAIKAGRRRYQRQRVGLYGVSEGEYKALVAQVIEEARFGDLYWDAYDGKLISDPSVDHLVPLSKGGKTEWENLVVTSLANNMSKSNLDFLYWLWVRCPA